MAKRTEAEVKAYKGLDKIKKILRDIDFEFYVAVDEDGNIDIEAQCCGPEGFMVEMNGEEFSNTIDSEFFDKLLKQIKEQNYS